LRREIEVLEQGPLPKASAELVIERDSTELDPSRAITCWIECGAITAMGRELELKAEQGLFFGLNPSASDEAFFKFRVSNGSMARLRMKYQGNHMWRLQMNNEVPEVRAGLRPRLPTGKLGRSEYVAVITRMAERGTYDLAFLHLDSQDFAELQTRSQELGTVGHTTATSSGRMYGWC